MPQTFQVLRCYKCLVFQVHQTKKSIKWQCKLCGEKQSLKRHYGVGTGKDCRVHVQKLNTLRGEINELKCSQMQRNVVSDVDSDGETEIQNSECQKVVPQPTLPKNSKWSNYVEEPEVLDESKESMHLGDVEVVLEIPKKPRKQFPKYTTKNNFKSNYNTKTHNDITLNNHHQYEADKSLCFRAPEVKISNKINTSETKVKLDISSDSPLKEKENFKPNVPVKKYIPAIINEISKWAQFAEDEEEHDTLTPVVSASESGLMFSLCDDNDLDNILDL